MADRMIGAGPGFDPHANSRARNKQGRFRGNKLKLVLVVAFAFLIGALVFQQYFIMNWQSSPAKAAIEVRPNSATLPKFGFDPVTMPVVVDPLATVPPKEVTVLDKVPPKREPPPRGSGAPRAAKAELPSRVTWDVQVAGAPDMSWVQDARRPVMGFGCALRPGASFIPAVLNGVVDSGVTPGEVFASVTSPVFDVDGVGNLLIPQGTKLRGRYQNALKFGQRRLGIMWMDAVLPSGRQLNLADSNGLDIAGSQGMGGEVETRWGEILAVATIFTLFDAAQRATVPDNESYSASVADAAATQYARVGTSVVKTIIDGAVTIKIPAGTQLIISPAKTLIVC